MESYAAPGQLTSLQRGPICAPIGGPVSMPIDTQVNRFGILLMCWNSGEVSVREIFWILRLAKVLLLRVLAILQRLSRTGRAFPHGFGGHGGD
jgi:hypothetical protein